MTVVCATPRGNPVMQLIKTYPMEMILIVVIVLLVVSAPGFAQSAHCAERAAGWVTDGNRQIWLEGGDHLGRD